MLELQWKNEDLLLKRLTCVSSMFLQATHNFITRFIFPSSQTSLTTILSKHCSREVNLIKVDIRYEALLSTVLCLNYKWVYCCLWIGVRNVKTTFMWLSIWTNIGVVQGEHTAPLLDSFLSWYYYNVRNFSYLSTIHNLLILLKNWIYKSCAKIYIKIINWRNRKLRFT